MRKFTLDEDSMEAILDMGSARTRFMKWLLSQMDDDGIVRGTVREMAERCHMSQATVTIVLQELLKRDIAERIEPYTYWFAGVRAQGARDGGIEGGRDGCPLKRKNS